MRVDEHCFLCKHRLKTQAVRKWPHIHYSDVLMRMMASQISSVSIVHSTVCSGADQRKHQSSVSLAFVSGIHRWPVNTPHKGQVTQKMSFDDVIMLQSYTMVFFSMVFSNFLKYLSSTFQKTQLTMNPFMFILMFGFGEATSHIAAKNGLIPNRWKTVVQCNGEHAHIHNNITLLQRGKPYLNVFSSNTNTAFNKDIFNKDGPKHRCA